MTVQIQQPCTEDWAGMTPDPTGRFCAVCSKTVHDFTDQSKEELLAFLLCSNSSPCVRTLASQRSFTPEEVNTVAGNLVRSGKSLSGAALALITLFATGCQPETPETAPHAMSITSGMVLNPPPAVDAIQQTDTGSPPAIMGKPAPTRQSCQPVVADPEPMILGEMVLMGAPSDVMPPTDTLPEELPFNSPTVPATK